MASRRRLQVLTTHISGADSARSLTWPIIGHAAAAAEPIDERLLISPPAAVGDIERDIDTPAAIVDLDQLEKNLHKMAALAADSGVAMRPHFKMHKCPAVALRQMELGAVGLCCQKVDEAVVMAHAGVSNILVSNEVISASKLDRLCALAPQLDWLGVCADCIQGADAIEAACSRAGCTIDVLVELDFDPPAGMEDVPFGAGYQRCGVQGQALVTLAQHIRALPHLRFGGIQAYYGKAQHVRSYNERKAAVDVAAEQVRVARDALMAVGIQCPKISGGGTGTAEMEARTGLWNELQAGSYAFMDVDYSAILGSSGVPLSQDKSAGFSSALFVLTEIMSNPGPGRLVVDAGLKASSIDSGLPIIGAPHGAEYGGNATYLSASDEHGRVLIKESSDTDHSLQLGDKIRLIPGHCDPTVNLYDWLVGVRKGRVECVWRVAGRGAR